MDITVSAIAEAVVVSLRSAAYAESTINQYKKAIKELKGLAEQGDGLYTKELGSKFAAMTTSTRTGAFSAQRRLVNGRLTRLFDSYVDTGAVDLSTQRRSVHVPLRSACLERAYLSWQAHMGGSRLALGTQKNYGRMAQMYLWHLESLGIWRLEDAETSSVFSFLESLMSARPGTSLYHSVTNFRPFLRYAERQDLVDAVDSVNARRKHAILPVISGDDEGAVIRACCNGSVPRRDAAIVLLAITTGMRACDIIALKMEDVCWEGRLIAIIQQKTGNPLTLPLLPAVGNAISRYLLEERPDSEYGNVFLRSFAPYAPMGDHASIHNIITRAFASAGITGFTCGTRVLRHNVATKMLNGGTSLPTIAALLGHAAPDSTSIYIGADEDRMRECVLPLPKGARP